MRQRRFLHRFEPVQGQIIQPESLTPEAPLEILERNGCACSLLYFMNDVLARSLIKGGGFEVHDDPAHRRQDNED